MKKYFPVFVLPTLLAFTIGFIVPFIMGVYLSFCKFTTVTDAKFVGLQNYVKIFTEDGTFGHALWYTTAFTVVSVVLINVIGFAVALLLTKKIKGTNIFRTVFFMPNLIGGIILGYVWQLLLNGLLLQINKTLTYSSVYGFWSKSLKELVSVRKVQMVMDGMTIGMITCFRSCPLFAPSICAASISSPGIFWIPAM